MDDILRRLYSGQYFPKEYINSKSETIKEDKRVMDKNHQRIMDALIEKYGEEMALQIDDEFLGAYATILNEEMFNIFKEGFYLGFEIVMTAMNRKNSY